MDFLLDAIIPPAMAQAAGAAQPSPWQPIIMLGVFFLIFWFFLIRPQMKRAKEHRELLSQLAKGDEVMTSGGILGRIEALSDLYVTIEIADGVRIRVQKQSVSAVLPKGTIKSA